MEANEDLQKKAEAILAKIRQQYAPDKRVTVFAIELSRQSQTLILQGETNLPEARQALLNALEAEGIAVQDDIQALPLAELGEKADGVITISVASIRSEPREPAELATQATLGTPVRIFKKQGGWCLVQTPDRYIAWADADALAWMTETEFQAWRSASKLIYLRPAGYAYQEANTASFPVSDLVGGAILKVTGENESFFAVAFPDGRKAFVAKSESRLYDEWLAGLRVSEQSLVQTARQFTGLPYLWGGTSYKAVDCSGFTKTVYLMNGMILPRDASQQVHTGQPVDTAQNFSLLKPGDLLFFGKSATDDTPERVTHVGMWIGNREFIHASSFVKVASVDPTTPNYDEFNRNRLLRVKRILGVSDPNIVQLSQQKTF